MIASEWIRSKIKVSEEVSPEEMVEYYRDHRAEFEFPTKARWEELMVRKSGIPAQAQQAYAKLAQMGNDVWPRLSANPPADDADVRRRGQGEVRRRQRREGRLLRLDDQGLAQGDGRRRSDLHVCRSGR